MGETAMEDNEIRNLYQEGERLAHAGQLSEAEAIYESLLARESEISPDVRAAVLNDLAVISVSRGSTERAAAYLKAAVRDAPFHREARHNLIQVEEMQGIRPPAQELNDYLMTFYGQDESAKSYITVHLRRFAEMLHLLGSGGSGIRLLELGANTYFSLLLRRFTAYEVSHTDLWKGEAEKTLRLRSLDGSESVELRLYNFDAETDHYPFPDGFFDIAVAAEIIEHLPNDPMFMMHELNRVLKDGGKLLLTTPNITSLRSFYALLHAYPPYVYNKFSSINGGRHCKEYAPREIVLLYQRSGFILEQLETLDVWIDSEPGVDYWKVYQKTHQLLQTLGSSLENRGEDIFALGRKVSAPLERYPLELYD